MQSAPLREQYALLKSGGLAPLAAVTALCRSNPGQVSPILEWFARKNPDAGLFRERWLHHQKAESSEHMALVGINDQGCFQYSSFAHRPSFTVFIKWDEIRNLYVQDGRHVLVLSVYSHGRHGEKFLHAQSDMPGFAPFLQEVSSKFFGSLGYLDNVFKRGGHVARKFQVWPRNELVE